MPLYFFNVRDSTPLFGDRRGLNFSGLAEALDEAYYIAAQIVGGLLAQPSLFANLKVDICDAVSSVMQTIDMPDAGRFSRWGHASDRRPTATGRHS
jgi:hypothetical protein